MSSPVDNLANKVALEFANRSGEKQAAFDPQWILVIIDILNLLRPMIERCSNNGEGVSSMARRPSLLQRRLLKLRVRQVLGISADRQHGHQMSEAILKVGANASVEEVEAFLNE